MTTTAKALPALLLAMVASIASGQAPKAGVKSTAYYADLNGTTLPPVAAPPPLSPIEAPMPTIAQAEPAVPSVPTVPSVRPTGYGCNQCSEVWNGACLEGLSIGEECAANATAPAGVQLVSGPDGAAVGDVTPVQAIAPLPTQIGPTGVPTPGVWPHFSTAYASALYFRPRNADVAFAVPINGPIAAAPAANPIQIGGVGVVDPDYELAFTTGLSLAINSMTSLDASVLILDTNTSNAIGIAAPNVMRSIVSHPSSASAATDFLTASANLSIDLEMLDLGIRHLFVGGEYFAVNYWAGARYARLEQMFDATFVDNGTEQVVTDIDFDGIGIRCGLDFERHACRLPTFLYGRGCASFLAGRFRGNYFQGQTFDPNVVNTNWEAGRIVPILDFELGAGWASPGGRIRMSAGYQVSAWFNTVKTEDFIGAVQSNNFVELHDSLTFDGLRATLELRF